MWKAKSRIRRNIRKSGEKERGKPKEEEAVLSPQGVSPQFEWMAFINGMIHRSDSQELLQSNI